MNKTQLRPHQQNKFVIAKLHRLVPQFKFERLNRTEKLKATTYQKAAF